MADPNMANDMQEGVHQPPQLFYDGVVFGISNGDFHKFEYTDRRHLTHSRELHHDLLHMTPRPTHVMLRQSDNKALDWHESGYAVYFAYSDLAQQGLLSSDKFQPWKRIVDSVLDIARHHRQILITAWYAHAFGAASDDTADDPHKYKTVIQQVIPTRTGLDGIKSTAAVWMSAVNNTAPIKPPRVYRKAWTEEELQAFADRRRASAKDASPL